MKSINFDEGYKEYALNDDESRVIRVRISDPNLLSRVEKTMSQVNDLIKKYKNRPVNGDNMTELTEFDSEVKGLLNETFGTDICTPIFGGASVLTPTADGDMLIFSFFNAFLPVLKSDMEAAAMTARLRKPEVRPEVQKYLDPVTVKPVSKPIAGLASPVSALPDVSGLTPEQKQALIAQLL